MSRKKSYFVWTKEKKYVLAQLALKYKGYKNSDRTHAEKWEQILEKLKLKVGFEELDIKPVPLHNHFKRMMEDVSELTGTSREGANLSGLPEEPSEYIKIMLNMYEEVHQNNAKHVRRSTVHFLLDGVHLSVLFLIRVYAQTSFLRRNTKYFAEWQAVMT